MPRLPDASDLGSRPIPESSRPIVGYRAGQEAEAMAQAGEVLTHTGSRLQEQQDRLANAYAESALLKGHLDALDSLQDNEYGTYEKRYTERMSQVRQQAAKMIPHRSQRSLFEADAKTTITRGLSQVRDRAHGKEREFGQAGLLETLDQNRDAALRAGDEGIRSRLILATNDAITGAVAKGYVAPDAAVRMRQSFLTDYGRARAEMLSPAERVKMLTAPPTGEGFAQAYQIVARNEGGFTPSDGASGAPAIYGINAKWHPHAFAEAKRLTDTQGSAAGQQYAQEFYHREFWDKKGIASLPAETQAVVFDGVVNHSTKFGDQLLAAARQGATPQELMQMRAKEYERLASANPQKYAASLPGWKERLNRVSAQANGKAGDWTDFLPPEDKVRLLTQAKHEAGITVRQQAAEIEQVSRLGLVVPREKIDAVATQAQAADLPELAQELRGFAQVQEATSAFAKQGLSAQEAELQRLKTATESGDLQQAPFFSAAQKVYEHKVKLLREEPWSYYEAQGVVQSPQPLTLGDGNAVAAQLSTRRAAATAVEQLESGRVKLPLLTGTEIASLKNLYDTAPPPQAATALASVGQNLNREERQTLARAIAPKAPMTAVALSVAPEQTLRLISGSRAQGEVSEAKVRAAANKQLGGVVFDPEANEALHQAVFAYYKQLALEKGDTTQEVADTLLQQAVTDLAGPRIELSLGMFAPNSRVLSYRDDNGQWVDENRMEDIFAGLTDEVLFKTVGALPQASDGQPVPAEEIKRRAQFLTAGDGVYVAVYPGLGVVTGKDGQPYRFDARKLEATEKQLPAKPAVSDFQAGKVGTP